MISEMTVCVDGSVYVTSNVGMKTSSLKSPILYSSTLQKQQQYSCLLWKNYEKNVSYSFTIFPILMMKYISARTINATYQPRCALVSSGNNFAKSNPTMTKSIFATVQSIIVKWWVTFLMSLMRWNMGMGGRGKYFLYADVEIKCNHYLLDFSIFYDYNKTLFIF